MISLAFQVVEKKDMRGRGKLKLLDFNFFFVCHGTVSKGEREKIIVTNEVGRCGG